MNKDTIVVYWAPAAFDHEKESWNMLYQEPVPIKKDIHTKALPNAGIKICPAVKDFSKNLFSIKSMVDDNFEINLEAAKEVMENGHEGDLIPTNKIPKVGLSKMRDQEYTGHYNYEYNLSWLMFADEPLEVEVSSPFIPPSSPLKGAFLPPGKLDIGKWYRSINLEYVTPQDTTTFSIKKGQDLIYLKFLTDKDIVFKKYFVSDKLVSLTNEFSQSPFRFGFFKELEKRYLMASKSKMQKIVLSEIKRNLVED